MRLTWTAPALRDLHDLRAYIARDRPGAAERQATLVLTAAGGLLDFPQMGRPGRRHGTRELVVAKTPFILVYRRGGEAIDLLRVLHGRRQWPDRF
ncbi:MAG TPA: type II toxin-antitoxin system RelE/ParE family toxin [Caulobacteraceae bacterium]|nr:type II toxin-antitoxin system RelE/ParE family toxin [Caulobacteraceae bacterium]